MTLQEELRFELARYGHSSFDFDVLKSPVEDAEDYVARMRARDVDHPRFESTFPRFLYGCNHNHMAELFTKTPREQGHAQ